MNRKEFLRTAGIAAGVAAITPLNKAIAGGDPASVTETCALIPTETAGPFPLDLSRDATKFRQDIREDQEGVLLHVKLRIVGTQNCAPFNNARVDIWHCNTNGNYSGYTTNGHTGGSQNLQGKTWLRGIQMTDVNGEVEFKTIFPGWYSGRTVHIHFQVYLSSMLQVTSQLTFPTEATNALLLNNTPYSTWGSDPTPAASDNVFRDGYSLQLATLEADAERGGYKSFLEVAINGSGTTALLEMEPETAGQFKLGQNYPNPFIKETVIPFTLLYPSNVTLEIWDISGNKVASLTKMNLPDGAHDFHIDTDALGLAHKSYVYQLSVTNAIGTYRQCKVMTGM